MRSTVATRAHTDQPEVCVVSCIDWRLADARSRDLRDHVRHHMAVLASVRMSVCLSVCVSTHSALFLLTPFDLELQNLV